METIAKENVRTWVVINNVRAPKSVSYTCPHCLEKVIFTLDKHGDDLLRLSLASSSQCPACNKGVNFWAIRSGNPPADKSGDPIEIYMYPPVTQRVKPPSLPDNVPDPLKRAFMSAVDALNQKNYAATAVCARRTLEGIFKYLLPETERHANLAELIERTKAKVDLAAPLSSLSHAIRDGGNLGAHFDMEKEPTEPICRQMVELVGYLITYLYVLPKEIAGLEAKLGRDA